MIDNKKKQQIKSKVFNKSNNMTEYETIMETLNESAYNDEAIFKKGRYLVRFNPKTNN